jgi:hypothetical protein
MNKLNIDWKDFIKHPHLLFPRKLWYLEIICWLTFGWFVVILGYILGW